MVEMPMNGIFETLPPFGKTHGVFLMTCHACHLDHISETLAEKTIADMKHRLTTDVNTIGCQPVAKKPTASLGVGPTLQDSVLAMLFHKTQPAAHLAVMAKDQTAVAVIEICAPRSLDDEAAPIGTTAGVESGCYIGQVARRVHRIFPCTQPIEIGVVHIPEGLQRHCGRITVTAVTHTLNMRAVHHIAAKGEAGECVFHHIVDGVEAWV